jgi:PIN domain nuclease of toxin-antitoxin system
VSGPAGLVIDTSALVAPILGEPGAEVVRAAFAGSQPVLLSTVNLAETAGVLARRHGLPAAEALADILRFGVEILPFGADEAAHAAPLLAAHRGVLSLGDAACLATAMLRGAAVLTADRAWTGLGLGAEIRLVR